MMVEPFTDFGLAGVPMAGRAPPDGPLVRAARPPGAAYGVLNPRTVRVSFSALLRIKDDHRYVLFHMRNRPGSYGPPGGVYKFFPPAARLLDSLGFRQERFTSEAGRARADLRGFLPSRSVRRFVTWFDGGAYREDTDECLRRELEEELEEVGLPALAGEVPGLAFAHHRTLLEGPYNVPGRPYRQLRRFDVYDLVTTHGAAAWLWQRLIEVGGDPSASEVVCATESEILHGRCGAALIAPHSAYLIGVRRKRQSDLPPML
ncbi:SMODS-associated NUDIX domain-containing protein [Sphaerisporangium aureirubrum]|uniref:CD-NTase-associated protein 16 NUDIX domain-containing protein n=1 Tax=Sphaerisporangium aureirubrum TaxID=1544736 RepID=A0ABW1NGX7_9ACTN